MTFNDVLQTMLKLSGGPAYAKELDSAAHALDKHAEAEKRLQEGSKQLGEAFKEAGGNATLLKGALVAVTAVAAEALHAFADEEQVLFRTETLLKNLGNTLPIGKVEQWADSLRQSTSFSDKAVISLIGLEKQFGIADNQVQGLAKTILDATKGNVKGLGLEEVADSVLRAINGQTRGLKQLGVLFEDTGNKANNMLIIEQKLNALFGGAAAADRNTLAGSFDALKSSLEELLEAVGSQLASVVVPALNAATKAVDFFTAHSAAITSLLGGVAGASLGAFFGPGGALIGGAVGLFAGLLPHKANAAAQVGSGKDRLATEATLSKIEENTGKTVDAFVKGVLGGPGTIAKAAFTARDARIAFGI